jgi:hypothetical protein
MYKSIIINQLFLPVEIGGRKSANSFPTCFSTLQIPPTNLLQVPPLGPHSLLRPTRLATLPRTPLAGPPQCLPRVPHLTPLSSLQFLPPMSPQFLPLRCPRRLRPHLIPLNSPHNNQPRIRPPTPQRTPRSRPPIIPHPTLLLCPL